ncbi:MAG TPA: DoxX protein [Candidatus Alistipes merdigallinarum]|nr:DoxX protein [Candidatus Alistipes merdigallinarum]
MKRHPVILSLSRWIIALTFIFSGFVKAVDPWGTAIKLGEYFSAFGMDWLSGTRYFIGIVLPMIEMTLGLSLLFRIRERTAARWSFIFILFFTLLSLVLVIWNPVADCGCFGDYIKLTNGQTFIKNLVLLSFAFLLWRITHRESLRQRDRQFDIEEWSMILLFSFFSAGIGGYSLRHLPVFDFLPYHRGVNITRQMPGDESETITTLIYKDRTTGKEHQFALTDTTWYDSLRWEYVDTHITERKQAQTRTTLDFALFDSTGNRTAELLAERDLFLITLTDTEEPLPDACRKRLEEVASYAAKNEYSIVCATPSTLPADGRIAFGAARIPAYNIDGTTLKTLIRAKNGLVLLHEGTILNKWNCRDIPDFEGKYSNLSPLEVVIEQNDRCRKSWVLGVLIAGVLLAGGGYSVYRKKSHYR